MLVDKNKFLEQVKAYFKNENLGFAARLIDYYDDETFNGEINNKDIIFKKQKKYSYQK
ncbi:hypothetical protein [Methylomonas rivi]|uniref:Uncharacterized protein n=1 Tax=Methylomonas rivi TaxID=2952226 RepID=A0ABT1UA20_9GAMM|nr:hypothetical protein [Methylomonas sp. WSC-6]MCQ8130704.1 hypothetical protein [Methylomonas sp. WSC-6]